ncbi:MAG: hypothetical protein KF721_15535 [Ignavibacteriaceae bacterium]|nr:hypothetical protein [Ignavibacteriaceae bacterium]
MFNSTDSLRNSEKFYKYLRSDLVRPSEFNYLNCLRIISFLEEGKLLQQAFHPKYQLIPINGKNPKAWAIKNDTLSIDNQSFLLRYYSENSLIVQEFTKDSNNKIILLGYDTYYRIGI